MEISNTKTKKATIELAL
ncbi:hypothetical protein WBJ53_09995 [Spirosoma sp. SC4-14]